MERCHPRVNAIAARTLSTSLCGREPKSRKNPGRFGEECWVLVDGEGDVLDVDHDCFTAHIEDDDSERLAIDWVLVGEVGGAFVAGAERYEVVRDVLAVGRPGCLTVKLRS